ncbi:Serine-rich protein-related [Gossypium australe]|uniref:Serine-rich protein-related n=1 Tax=Gossypium australe TaxID=47621 RepID=A0A5B6WB99_9ROSI|nr:Serine-rich protein-related [Gossypium australe]
MSVSSNSKSGRLTCLCSPTSHPGSFRCTLHRSFNKKPPALSPTGAVPDSPNYQAKVKPIKPASHCIQRKRNFQPKPSRFCLLNGHRNSVVVAVS